MPKGSSAYNTKEHKEYFSKRREEYVDETENDIRGRPSKYDPEIHIPLVKSLFAKGYSVRAVAAKMGLVNQTLYNWRDRHPDFAEAMEIGQGLGMAMYEDFLRETAENNTGSASATIFAVKNKNPDEWKDKHEVEQTTTHKVVSADALADLLKDE